MSETPTVSRRLLVEERRRLIVDLVEQQGRATVEELATRFGTSTVTIRADLDALARSSAIARSHGGALPVAPATNDTPLNIKETRWHAQKLRIGHAAAKMIQDGETIILDSGSTTVEIARQIRQMKFESLTVITNALNIALELSGLPHIRVMMLGGLLRDTSYSLVGPDAEQALSKLSADKLFLGVDGLDPVVGVTTPDPLEASLNALMIRVSRETIAVFDASKLGQRSLSVITTVQHLHRAITDSSAEAKAVESLRAAGVEVTLV
ncbi:MAG: DeoR/GlpR family DNA-binding transcription regulator [Pseudomonadota bacterium]|jgi:DeoR family transcriptional regulator, aga operon transcriptional repressor|uniref:DeoR/GlpR family DNA-binding transcription regulator n=1 Tax=Rhodanobacter sp. OK091 TaxID=1881037 RepID=UPI000912DA38|nr:DeoR/GlpR family DNA-binding transcription regulator [Rhodanobacter sp. OK091]SHL64438.1 transcriptional regulator, DeoR family [Rhodanobacter sp. OK091]